MVRGVRLGDQDKKVRLHVRALTLSKGMAAFRPTRTLSFNYYDLYPPNKVVS